jgi:hypothetical protein
LTVVDINPEDPSISRKSVYQMWLDVASTKWKRDEDEVKSAKILLEEARQSGKQGMYTVEPIPLEEEDGFKAIAFTLPDVLRKFGGRVRELSLDSACE